MPPPKAAHSELCSRLGGHVIDIGDFAISDNPVLGYERWLPKGMNVRPSPATGKFPELRAAVGSDDVLQREHDGRGTVVFARCAERSLTVAPRLGMIASVGGDRFRWG